jgi:hypothetical protein
MGESIMRRQKGKAANYDKSAILMEIEEYNCPCQPKGYGKRLSRPGKNKFQINYNCSLIITVIVLN